MNFEGTIPFILVGAGGGVARCILGWANSKEAFDATKLVKSILRAGIGGATIGMLFGFGLKETFFTAFAADVGSKEGFAWLKSKLATKE
jgi:hypothetical protein